MEPCIAAIGKSQMLVYYYWKSLKIGEEAIEEKDQRRSLRQRSQVTTVKEADDRWIPLVCTPRSRAPSRNLQATLQEKPNVPNTTTKP